MFRLEVQSTTLDEDELSSFVGKLNTELNDADGVTSSRATRLPKEGERAFELLLDPHLWIEIGQSAAVSGLIGVLKAYIQRERRVDFRLRADNGTELELSAKNFDDDKVMELLSQFSPSFAEAPAAFAAIPQAEATPVSVFEPPKPKAAGAKGKRKTAIVIGMNAFDDPELENLNYARNDAVAMHNLLQGETGERFDHVELITEGGHSAALTRIEEITNETRRDDLLLIYYAGHGLVRNQKLHLAFADTRSAVPHSTAMKYGNLLDVVEQATARARLVILDCCYAGAASEDAPRSALSEQVQMELGASSRTLVMTSSTGTQVAREAHGHGHGVFTKHLLDGLRGAADANGDGSVDTRELFDYLEEQMAVEHLQRPQKFNFAGSGAVTLRKTGLHPHRDLARRLRKQVSDLHHDGLISETQSESLNQVLKLNLDQMNPLQRRQFRLLEQHLKDGFKPGRFFDDWEQLARTKPRPLPVNTKNEPQRNSRAEDLGKTWAHIKKGKTSSKASAKPSGATASGPVGGSVGGTKTKPTGDNKTASGKRPWATLSSWDKFMRVCSYIGLFFVGMFVLGMMANF